MPPKAIWDRPIECTCCRHEPMPAELGHQPAFNLCGVFTTGGDGSHRFRAVKPKLHPIPGDGPAGWLLGQPDRSCRRRAHLRHITAAPGHDTFTVHICDPDDPHITSDAVFGTKDSLLAEFVKVEDSWRSAAFRFDGPIGRSNSTLFRSGPEPRGPRQDAAARAHPGPQAKLPRCRRKPGTANLTPIDIWHTKFCLG